MTYIYILIAVQSQKLLQCACIIPAKGLLGQMMMSNQNLAPISQSVTFQQFGDIQVYEEGPL